MGKTHKISLFDRLETFHLEAYFGVKSRAAQKRKKMILDCLEKRQSGLLTLYDLAAFDGYLEEEMEDIFLKTMERCLERKDEASSSSDGLV